MDFEQIKELVKLLQETNISEFKIENEHINLSIRTKDFNKGSKEVFVQPSMMMQGGMPQMMQAPMQMPTAPVQSGTAPETTAPANTEAPSNVKYLEIKSPMVGTFYRSAGPEKPVFASVGDVVGPNDNVCLIEAMKLFNEVKAEISGRIVKVMVEDASPVEYDQVLFLVEPA